jgi:transcriptional regulator with XRE-family HTH domain
MSRTHKFSHNNALGKRLCEERAKHGWSREDVVDKLLEIHRATYTKNSRKLSPSADTVKRWEEGENRPEPYYRDLLCEVFQIDRKVIDALIVISSGFSAKL